MKHAKLLSITLILTVLSGCAAVGGVAPRKTNELPLQSQLATRIADSDVHVRGDMDNVVYAVVVDSPRLTDEFRYALANAGIQVADSRNQTTVVYELDGIFQASRITGRIGRISLGKYAEQPDSLVARREGYDVLGQEMSNMLLFGDLDGSVKYTYAQTAVVVLKAIRAVGESVTAIEVELPLDQAMQPIALFQAGLDALCKAIGLPERSLLIAQPQATQ
ncbi:MAG: hypothetical protein FWH15_03725 [Betaproteobacteria bacterium]|nr:hypothetical protein [Betaproteobacteria bacterium]